MNIFTNPWFVGIGGGLVSSTIVFFITRYFFTKGENREYNQNVASANNEILHSIRPLIVEKAIPTSEMLESVFTSTSKRYKVDKKDLYNEETLSNDLVNEIMANVFLATEVKVELCGLVNKIKLLKQIGGEPTKGEHSSAYKNISVKYLSTVISAITGFTTIIYTFLVEFKHKSVVSGNIEIFTVIIIFVSVAISIISVMLPYYFKKLKDSEKMKKEMNDALEKVYGSKYKNWLYKTNN